MSDKLTSRCPWGCGGDRVLLDGEVDPSYLARCGSCGGTRPSPQTEMNARLEGKSVESWLRERYPRK